MRTLIILTLVFGINSCFAQSDTEKKLIGKWILTEETSSWNSKNETLVKMGKGLEVELNTNLTFKKDKTIFINQMGDEYNTTYELTDSILTIGNRNYIILKINKRKLIYKNKDGLFDKVYKYKKVK